MMDFSTSKHIERTSFLTEFVVSDLFQVDAVFLAIDASFSKLIRRSEAIWIAMIPRAANCLGTLEKNAALAEVVTENLKAGAV